VSIVALRLSWRLQSFFSGGTYFFSCVIFTLVERKNDTHLIEKYHAAAGKTHGCDAEWLNCVSPKRIASDEVARNPNFATAIVEAFGVQYIRPILPRASRIVELGSSNGTDIAAFV
jgi:hypothetical protein